MTPEDRTMLSTNWNQKLRHWNPIFVFVFNLEQQSHKCLLSEWSSNAALHKCPHIFNRETAERHRSKCHCRQASAGSTPPRRVLAERDCAPSFLGAPAERAPHVRAPTQTRTHTQLLSASARRPRGFPFLPLQLCARALPSRPHHRACT